MKVTKFHITVALVLVVGATTGLIRWSLASPEDKITASGFLVAVFAGGIASLAVDAMFRLRERRKHKSA